MMTDQKAPGLRLTEQEDELLNLLFNAMFINGRVENDRVNEQIPLVIFSLLNQAHCRDLVIQLRSVVDLETQLGQAFRENMELRLTLRDVELVMHKKHHTYTRFKQWFNKRMDKMNTKIELQDADEEVQP